VASGATYFHIDSQKEHCVARFDGAPLPSSDLENPMAPLFGKVEDRRLHFALALLGAKQLSPDGVKYRSPEANLDLVGGNWVTSDADDSAEKSTFTVNRPFRLLSERWNSKPSLSQVMQICHQAPLRLKVDGKRIYTGYYSPAYNLDLAGHLELTGDATIPEAGDDTGYVKKISTQTPYSAILYFCQPSRAAQSGFSVVRNGICYKVTLENLPPGVCGQIVHPRLRRDLSGAGLVRDTAFREMAQRLAEESRAYLTDLIKSELRLRRGTLALMPAIKTLPPSEDIASWLEAVEQYTGEALEDEDELREALASDDRQQAETVAFMQLSKLTDKLDRWSYDTQRILLLGARQEWLSWIPFSHPRLDQAVEFRDLCRVLTGEEPESVPHSQSKHFVQRFRGRTREALSTLDQIQDPTLQAICRSETLIALNELDEARQSALNGMSIAHDSEVVDYSYGQECRLIDLLVFVLELEGEHDKALDLSENLTDSCYCDFTNYLRDHHRVEKERGRMPFTSWLKKRARASGRGAWLHLTFKSKSLPKSLRAALAGKPEGDLQPDLKVFFSDVGSIYCALRDYVTAHVAHQFRLSGQPIEADQLLATMHILVRTMELTDQLCRGASEPD
jgi:hypothetical protein